MAKVIAVAHSKGGVGKTTFCRNLTLAYRMNNPAARILALDCDGQKSLEKFFSDRAERLNAVEIQCHLKINPKGLSREIKALAGDYEKVFCDVGGQRDGEVLRQVLLASDVVIIPTSPSQEDLDSLDEFFMVIDEVRGVNENLKAYIFINRASWQGHDKRARVAIDGLAQKFEGDAEMLPSKISNLQAWSDSGTGGHAIWEIAPGSRAEREFTSVYLDLEGKGII